MGLRFDSEEDFDRFLKNRSFKGKSPPQRKPVTHNEPEAQTQAINEKESEIQNRIRDYLRACGWYVMRHHQSLGSLKGMSDLTAIKDGVTIYIEVKTPKGKQSKYQIEFENEIVAHGGTYILARSVDDVISKLKKNI